jgi:heat shock protein HtpX
VIIAAGGGLVVMVALLGVMALGQLLLSERLAMRAMHARVVPHRTRLGCAGSPAARRAISDVPTPNAFAMGRSPKHAVVCVTEGLLQLLERNELEGVLAHEIAHIRNRDVALMTMASFFASLAALVGQVAAFGGLGRDRDSGPGLAVILLVSVGVYFLSYFLLLALSRYREFAADRSAALVTGRPSALAAALSRLQSASERAPSRTCARSPRCRPSSSCRPRRGARSRVCLRPTPRSRSGSHGCPAWKPPFRAPRGRAYPEGDGLGPRNVRAALHAAVPPRRRGERGPAGDRLRRDSVRDGAAPLLVLVDHLPT